jgi:hypothetical protein
MKVTGLVVILLGIIVVYIGITGSQHRIMDIIKGVHLSGSGSTAKTTAKVTIAPTGGNPGGKGVTLA